MFTPDHTELLSAISRFPTSPGVYLMKDSHDRLLYIGKAVNLRNRVRSYFVGNQAERFQIPAMLAKIHQIDWIATGNEAEALILEANLIRRHKPAYNIDLKDDKHYPYLKLTMAEPFPRLLVVRRVLDDQGRYFGPYTDVPAMNGIVAFSRKAFGIRRCSRSLPLDKPVRPCLYYSIGQCSGACAGKISAQEYGRAIGLCIEFLAGRRSEVVRQLQEWMHAAAARQEFERAASLRDQVRLIKESPYLQQVDLKDGSRCVDVFGVAENERHLCLCVLCFREGLLQSKRHFLFKREIWALSAGTIETSVIQYYQNIGGDPPDEILLPLAEVCSVDSLQSWFNVERGRKVIVSIPQRGPKARLVALAATNARLSLVQKVAPDPQLDVAELRQALNLPVMPRVIEAFDISNLGATFAVAGMVRFTDGLADKSGYRRYKIRTVTGQDDFAMLMEAVQRRLRRLTEESREFPDLLLIDGGKGQLHAALQGVAGFEHPPMVAALAKKEETLFSPWCEAGVVLPANHPARRLVERIRDEVHRWAVGYHRTLRDKGLRHSKLEEIAGLGPALSGRLIRHFGSLQRVNAATMEQIAEVRGVTAEMAGRIKAHLAAEKQG
jgi:excinuclease ABC subunit C